jgi:hypothetical protein
MPLVETTGDFTMSDRKTLIRLASTLPKGSKERKAILAGLKKTAAEESEDFLDRKLDRDWKKALKAVFAWKGKGDKTNERIHKNLRRDPDNFDYRQEMLAVHDQYRKEGPMLLKGVEAIIAAAKKHPISKDSYFRQAEDNLSHAKHGFKTYDPYSGKYQDDPEAQHYKGSYGYGSLMSAIYQLALARGEMGLNQQGR